MKKAARHLKEIGRLRPHRPGFHLRTHRKLKLFVISFFLVGSIPLFFYVRWALGATATWTNGGGDGLWSNCANWSGGTGTGGCPGTNDIATFNSTSTANATIDTSISVAGINIASSYTGTITQNSTFTVTIGASGFTQAGGTFTGGDSAITLNNTSGSFSLSGGIFSNTSATMSIVKNMTISAGTFNNSGTVKFNSTSINNTQTLTCSQTLPGTFDIAQTSQSGLSFVLSANCTITLASNVTTVGTITNNGTINATTLNVGGFALTNTSTNNGTLNVTNLNFDGGDFNQNGTLNISGTTTFDSNSSTSSGDQTLTCSGTYPSTVIIAQTTYYTQNFILSSGCTMTVDPSSATTGSITNNGTMNATSFSLKRNFTQNGTFNLTGTLTFNHDSSINADQALSCNGNLTTSGGLVDISESTYYTIIFTLGSGCTINLVSSVSTIGSITNNGTINATDITVQRNFTQNGTLNLSGTLTFSHNSSINTDQTLSCTGNLTGSGGVVNVNQTTYSTQSFTLGSGCIVALGSTVTTPGSITNNGTMNGTNATVQSNFTQNGTFILSGTLTLSGTTSSGTVSCSNPIQSDVVLNKTSTGTLTIGSNCTITGNFTRTDGQIANSSSAYTLSIQGNLSLTQTDTIGGGNLTLELSGSGNQTISQNAAMTISSPFNVNKTGGSASLSTSLTTGTTCDVVSGTFYLNGQIFTCGSTFTVRNGGNLQLIGSEGPTTPTLNSGSTVTYVGDGDSSADLFHINNWSYSNLTINGTDSNDTFATSNTLASNMDGYWAMDEASGSNVSDSSGNGKDATATGTTVVAGEISNGRSLNGSSDFITVPSGFANYTGGITISVWANPSSSASWSRFIDLGLGQSNDNILFARKSTSADLACEVYNGVTTGGQVVATGAITNSAWHHYVCTVDSSGNVKMYKDGSQIQTGTTAVPPNVTRTSNFIGKSNWGTDALYAGSLDEVRVYNRVLSPVEISSLAAGSTDNSFSTLTIPGNFTVSGGIFSAPTTLNVAGNFTHSGGTFTNNSGTVVLNGSNQKIYGNTTFYNLTKSITNSPDTLTFEAGKTQTVTNICTLNGASGNGLHLQSTSRGTQWKIDPQGTRTFSYLNVQDSNNVNASAITTASLNINNLGNNTNWDFGTRPASTIHVSGTKFNPGVHITSQ